MNKRELGLSIEKLNELINRYYKNEKISVLIEEFGIRVQPSQLVKYFPTVTCEGQHCIYCYKNLVTKYNSRGSYKPKFSAPFCESCGHRDDQHCNCENCENEKMKFLNRIEAQKKVAVKNTFEVNLLPPPPKNLRLEEMVYFLSCIRHSDSEELSYIDPFNDQLRNLAPTSLLKKDIVKTLERLNLICISEESDLTCFTFNDSMDRVESYDESKVYWKVLPAYGIDERISYLIEIERIAKEKKYLNEKSIEIKPLWLKIAKYECIEYLMYLMEMHGGYSLKQVGIKTHSTFDSILQDYSVGQSFNLIWRSVNYTTARIVRENIPYNRAKNSFIGEVLSQAERAKANNYVVKEARRDYNRPQSILSSLFFDTIIMIGSQYFNLLYSEDHLLHLADNKE